MFRLAIKVGQNESHTKTKTCAHRAERQKTTEWLHNDPYFINMYELIGN